MFTLVTGEDRIGPRSPFGHGRLPEALPGPWPTLSAGPVPVDHSEVVRSVPFQYFWRVRFPKLDCGSQRIVWKVKIHHATFRNATRGLPKLGGGPG